jgi:hypothetical protein
MGAVGSSGSAIRGRTAVSASSSGMPGAPGMSKLISL